MRRKEESHRLSIGWPQNRHVPQVRFIALNAVFWKLQSVTPVSVHRRDASVPLSDGLF
jgi:hypothetical protein